MSEGVFFEYPWVLWLEFALLPLIALYVFRQLHKGSTPWMRVSGIAPMSHRLNRIFGSLRHIPFVLRLAALALMIVAIARPRSSDTFEKVDTEGIDIVMALEV